MKRASTIIIKKRMITVFLFAILIFLVIIARLAYVQLVLSDDLSDSANDLWTRDITFAAERGYILDSEGEILAENVTAPTVLLMPRQIKEPENTAKLLGRSLTCQRTECWN